MDERLRRSRAQEKRIARILGGKRHAGSGNGYSKNDAHNEYFLVECKGRLERNQHSITIKAADLTALQMRAYSQGRLPLFEVELGGHTYVIIPEDDFLRIHAQSLLAE